ncbi:MAG TPA: hypothetical protein VML54_14885 [Candidatus Limnocylindrales bacterium]|nr:hypothetical protein [Candidatus Limnocylindrales bacterium]
MATTECCGSELAVYMGSDGAICHAPCWQPLQYHGVRGGLAVDFYCPGCVEHVTLPLSSLPSIPMSAGRPAARRIGSGAAGLGLVTHGTPS